MVSGLFSLPVEPAETAPHGRTQAVAGAPLGEYLGGPENHLVQHYFQRPFDDDQYDPLVLYGPIHSGKSLLAQALLLSWRRRFPARTGLLVTGTDLARGLAEAAEDDSVDDIYRKYSAVDLLLIDDVDQLAGKPAAQQMLRCILDTRPVPHRLIVTTKSYLPDCETFSASLASRLYGGLTIPLALPATATREAMIRALASLYELTLDTDVVDLLVHTDSSHKLPLHTLPQINHMLLQLRHEAQAQGVAIDVALAHRILVQEKRQHTPTLRSITSLVARHYQLRLNDLRGASRRRAVVRARGVAIHLARQLTPHSLEEIGRHFGGRDHTTVLHACRQVERRTKADETLQRTLVMLESQLIV